MRYPEVTRRFLAAASLLARLMRPSHFRAVAGHKKTAPEGAVEEALGGELEGASAPIAGLAYIRRADDAERTEGSVNDEVAHARLAGRNLGVPGDLNEILLAEDVQHGREP